MNNLIEWPLYSNKVDIIDCIMDKIMFQTLDYHTTSEEFLVLNLFDNSKFR